MSVRAIGSIVGTDALTDEATFNVTVSIQVSDGVHYENGSVLVQIGAALTDTQFNAAVIDGVKAWVDSFHGWTISKTNIVVPQWHRGLI